MSDGWLKILYSSQSTMTVAPFASLLGSILGQPVGIDRWSGLSELADHQDHGVWRKYNFLYISVRGKWFWIDETGTRCIDFGRNVAYVEATAAAVKTLNMDSAHTSVKDSVEQEPEKKWKGPFRFFMVVDLLLICLLVCLVSLFSWLVRCFS